MRPNDWTDECGQGHDKPTHVLHMCSPIRLVLPLRTHVALVLNSWAAQFLVLVTDKRFTGRALTATTPPHKPGQYEEGQTTKPLAVR